mmetsp:Transcript_15760/g.44102  ORF Transcript_15760/g.44102 Transcript_15760/m.44102 type:complete len:321 (-) Transcript_15760:91-1053(-)
MSSTGFLAVFALLVLSGTVKGRDGIFVEQPAWKNMWVVSETKWQKLDPCSCAVDKNGPVCHPHTFEYVAACAAEAECQSLDVFVACHALRTISWENECSCRHTWQPVCSKGQFVAPNSGCADCLGLKFDAPCSDSGSTLSPSNFESDCNCEGDSNPVCSTVSGNWLAHNPCVANCRGFKSFASCSSLPHRKSPVHSTGVADVNITKMLCSSVGKKVGDVAAAIGCQKVYEQCFWQGPDEPLVAQKGWRSSLTTVPVCFSLDTKACYESATDLALDDSKCQRLLAEGSKACDAAKARALFGKAVSRVCGEEPRDGKRFGFW